MLARVNGAAEPIDCQMDLEDSNESIKTLDAIIDDVNRRVSKVKPTSVPDDPRVREISSARSANELKMQYSTNA